MSDVSRPQKSLRGFLTRGLAFCSSLRASSDVTPAFVGKLFRRTAQTKLSLFGVCILTLTGAPTMNAQNLIRPSSSGTFGGGATDRGIQGRYATPFLGPQNLESAARPPRGGATTFPATQQNLDEPLPSQGAASLFTGTEQSRSDTASETAAREASGPRYLLGEQKEPHNFRLGPIFFRLGASGGIEYCDNIDNSSTDRRSDLITNGTIFLNASWALTKINDLNLNVGFGYTSYLANPELNTTSQTLELVPGTELTFKMKIGEVYLNFYERPSLGQDTSNELTLRSGLIYSSFQNDAGVTAFLDLNDVIVQATYNRSDTIPLTSETNSVNRSGSSTDQQDADNATIDSLNRSVDTLSTAVTFRLRDDTSAGIEAAASRISYQEEGQNDGFSYNAGVFVGKQLTQYITLRVAGGYQFSSFDSGGMDNAVEGPNSEGGKSSQPYCNLELRHRVNRYLSHTLAIGYETDLGTSSDTVQTTYISDTITYQISKDVGINLDLSYEIGEESGGQEAHSLELFRATVSFGYTLTRKLSMSAYYEFVTRSGGGEVAGSAFTGGINDGTAGDYYQNRIGINFSYAF